MALIHLIGKSFKEHAYKSIYNGKYSQAFLNLLILQYIGDETQSYNAATLLRSGYISEISLENQKRLNFVFLKRLVDHGILYIFNYFLITYL